jgi:hypothetical protein
MSETVEIPQVSRIDFIASSLDSPRKLSFSPDGAFYVAEAGRGGTGASRKYLPVKSDSLNAENLPFYIY